MARMKHMDGTEGADGAESAGISGGKGDKAAEAEYVDLDPGADGADPEQGQPAQGEVTAQQLLALIGELYVQQRQLLVRNQQLLQQLVMRGVADDQDEAGGREGEGGGA